MRILHVIARMNVGGPAIQVCTITKGLPESEFEHLLLTGRCELGEVDYLELNHIQLPRVKVIGLGRSIDFLADIKALFFIRKQLVMFVSHLSSSCPQAEDKKHTRGSQGMCGRTSLTPRILPPFFSHTSPWPFTRLIRSSNLAVSRLVPMLESSQAF